MISLRFDRLLTLGVVGPARRASAFLPARHAGHAGRRSLPILMYHSISEDPEPGVSPYYRTATTPGRFSEQMNFLRLQGWRGVGLRQALEIWSVRPSGPAPEKLVALTFDDGFDDFRTEAAPVLRACGFGATMFLPTAYILESGGAPGMFRGRSLLNWSEIGRLHAAGTEFGSHTASHPRLVDLPWPSIENEIVFSKSEIEHRLGCAVNSFSYPFAFPQADAGFCRRFRAALIRAGYAHCVTTEIGCAAADDDPYRLRRLPVNDDDDLTLFAAKLEGDYDWLAGPQRAYKVLKHAIGG